MFINSRKTLFRLGHHFPTLINRSDTFFQKYPGSQLLNNSAPTETYSAPETIPIPVNVDAAETTRFSPHRSRDISSIRAHSSSQIDITNSYDNKCVPEIANTNFEVKFHIQSYDCNGSISLNSVMQSNVPTPFEGIHKISHLNMPGGQWSQECKFTSQSLQNSHYTCLRDNARANWADYQGFTRRSYTTQSTPPSTSLPSSNLPAHKEAPEKFSKKEQLKQAFKDYGATIVVFHNFSKSLHPR
ncbi:uncharacterized protein [Drosophila bipectinata]|uniref:uncharacterized protein isoform X2 n=1 Tax=Drosophila bipectinata TaxID=42026 RepID=UPI001C890D93|nr:uncharacterized protein LOC108132591 isoform X2 [Drosophila bipectinata]